MVGVRGQHQESTSALWHTWTDVVRCHRLNKECRPSVSVRRRNPKKPVVEERLDGLVSLLKAGAQPDAIASDTHATTAVYDSDHHSNVRTNDKTSLYRQTERSSVKSVLDDYLPNLPILTPGKPVSEGTMSNSSAAVPYDAVEPSPVDAEEYLTIFHTHKSKYFPFVYVPSTTTAQQLREERPFLWLCIMTIASRSTAQQQVLGSKIRHTLAEEMLLKSEQSVDLLLGLLAYVGWYGIFQSERSSIRY